jgi:hypothetical protein
VPGRFERRFEDMSGEFMSFDKPVESFAGIITVQGDDPVEIEVAKLSLENLNFRFARAGPKETVQVKAALRPARSFDVGPGIAHWVNKEFVTAGSLGISVQAFQQLDRRVNSALFVAVHPGEHSHSQVASLFARTGEKITWQA